MSASNKSTQANIKRAKKLILRFAGLDNTPNMRSFAQLVLACFEPDLAVLQLREYELSVD